MYLRCGGGVPSCTTCIRPSYGVLGVVIHASDFVKLCSEITFFARVGLQTLLHLMDDGGHLHAMSEKFLKTSGWSLSGTGS